MLYLVRKEDLAIACLDTAKDDYISFQPLSENLFCIGGCLLYNFTDDHIEIKMKELGLSIEDYVIMNFEEVLALILNIKEGK